MLLLSRDILETYSPIPLSALIAKITDYLGFSRADERIRTADPFITSEVLYQLSYVGETGRTRGPMGRAC